MSPVSLSERMWRGDGQPGHPLSYPQRRLWLLNQLYPRTPVHTVALGLWIDGPLDAARLAAALTAVVARHEVLRSAFRVTGGVPRQIVAPPAPVPVPVEDLTDAADPEAAAEEHADREARRSFDLSSGRLLRARLLRTGEHRHRLLLTVHRIACDAWSVDLLGRELADAYAGRVRARPSTQYSDFAEWQLAQDPAEQLGFWRERLADLEDIAPLPTDRPRPPVRSLRGGAISLPVVPGLAARVVGLARAIGATPDAVLLAGFAAVLSRYTGDERVAVGTVVANRNRPEVAELIGPFANTLVLRVNAPDRDCFTDLVATVATSVRSALGHQDLAFERLVDELALDRDPASNPLFAGLFSYRDDEPAWSLPGCRVRPAPAEAGTAAADLALSLVGGAEVTGRLEYSTDLFELATAQRLAAQYLTLLRAALAEPDRPLADLPMLPAGERERLLALSVSAASTVDAVDMVDTALHRLIERQSQAAPGSVALIDGDRRVTYRALDRRANGLAHRLRAQGVDAGATVGVYLDRGVDLVVALLGILKSGAACVPLDPALPPARLRSIAADAGLAAVVCGGVRLGAVRGLAPRVLYLPGPPRSRPIEPRGGLDDLACIWYPSASTGRPTGVQVTHRNLRAFASGMDGVLGRDGPGTWLAVAGASGDETVLELLWTLARGYRVVLGQGDPTRLMNRYGVTHVRCTTSLAQALVDGRTSPSRLRRLLVGAGALPADLAADLVAAAAGEVRVMYGRSEATVWATSGLLGNGSVHIGRPLAGVRAYVVDRRLRLAPTGVPGELLIGGDQVTQGYRGRPSLTASRFVPDAYSGLVGARLYRTGDLVRWRADGCLELLGRLDDHVKTRGPGRTELGHNELGHNELRHNELGDVVAPSDPVSPGPSAAPAGGRPAAGEVAARRRAATTRRARIPGRNP